jgi:hypothetical protein
MKEAMATASLLQAYLETVAIEQLLESHDIAEQ